MKLVLVASALMLAGCVTSPVVDLDGDNHLASVHTFFGVADRSQLVDKASAEANAYCAKEGKVAHVKNAVGTGVPGLTNLSGSVVFACETQTVSR